MSSSIDVDGLRDERFERPSKIPHILALGVWMVAALMVSLALPGNVPVAYLFGAVSGAPMFVVVNRYVLRAAQAEVFISERRWSRTVGGPRRLAAFRRLVTLLFGLDDPRCEPVAQGLVTFFKWFPTGFCALGSVAALLVAASPDSGGGFGSSMTAALGGVGAAFALMFRRRLGQTVAWPTEADLTGR